MNKAQMAVEAVDNYGFSTEKENVHNFSKKAKEYKAAVEKAVKGLRNGTDVTDSASDLIRIEWKGIVSLDKQALLNLAKINFHGITTGNGFFEVTFTK